MTLAYLGLGSNLGDRLEHLREAVRLLDAAGGVRVLRTSPVYETDPVGGPEQGPFLNAVAEVETSLDARGLLDAALGVEAALGRVRRERWGPRTIDIDVLMFGNERIDEPDLVVPHPRMHERAFVTVPLADLLAGRPGEADPQGAGVRWFAAPIGRDGTQTSPRTIAIVGAGRVGTAFGALLERAGHEVVAASGREASRARVAAHFPQARFESEAAPAARGADLVIVSVPDDAIGPTVEAIASAGSFHRGQVVVHVSGSTSLDALEPARAAGATVLSLHPLQSFPDVATGVERLPGSGIAVTGHTDHDSALGERIARHLGGRPFRLEDSVKPLYHAAAVFAANYLVTVEGLAERILRSAGVDDPMPILEALARTSFDRAFAIGPGEALTGPAVRGDVGTIERNLAALAEGRPDAVEAYRALGLAAARIAADAGRLGERDLRRVEEALRAWT